MSRVLVTAWRDSWGRIMVDSLAKAGHDVPGRRQSLYSVHLRICMLTLEL